MQGFHGFLCVALRPNAEVFHAESIVFAPLGAQMFGSYLIRFGVVLGRRRAKQFIAQNLVLRHFFRPNFPGGFLNRLLGGFLGRSRILFLAGRVLLICRWRSEFIFHTRLFYYLYLTINTQSADAFVLNLDMRTLFRNGWEWLRKPLDGPLSAAAEKQGRYRSAPDCPAERTKVYVREPDSGFRSMAGIG